MKSGQDNITHTKKNPLPQKKTHPLKQPSSTTTTKRTQDAQKDKENEHDSDTEYQTDKAKEARKWVKIAKTYVGESRNLKTELKDGILRALTELYQIAKTVGTHERTKEGGEEESERSRNHQIEGNIEETLKTHSALIEMHMEEMKLLRNTIEKSIEVRCNNEQVLEELKEVKIATENIKETMREKASTQVNTSPHPQAMQGITNGPSYAAIVTSDSLEDDGHQLPTRVRKALDAKTNGLQIQNIKNIRDHRVVVKCQSKKELERAIEHLRRDKELEVQVAKNKDPLVILKNVLTSNTDEDIGTALRTQNAHLTGDLSAEEGSATVKFRRRARNPHECHVVLQVSPRLWQRLIDVGRVFIDVQRVRVEDQTPLVQCSRCLAYGHGRKLCIEPTETCHHCGGRHIKQECPDKSAGKQQSCINCRRAKAADDGHAVYSEKCPVRKKFDALARQTTAYC